MDAGSTFISIPPPLQPVASGGQQRDSKSAETERPYEPKSTQMAEITTSELRQLEQLKRRDREVKAHELAHKATAGQYAKGGASYEYQRGPDGRLYAVGGEVSIDISKEADPEKTLQKALIVQRAALAPADPSGQDRQIAMQASQMATEARQEIRAQEQEVASKASASDASFRQGPSASKQTDDNSSPTNSRSIASYHQIANIDQTTQQFPIDQFI